MQTNIDSQPKKLSSQKKRWSKNAETILKLTANEWWPFDRVDGKLLQKLHKAEVSRNQEDALL